MKNIKHNTLLLLSLFVALSMTSCKVVEKYTSIIFKKDNKENVVFSDSDTDFDADTELIDSLTYGLIDSDFELIDTLTYGLIDSEYIPEIGRAHV